MVAFEVILVHFGWFLRVFGCLVVAFEVILVHFTRFVSVFDGLIVVCFHLLCL